MKTANSRISFIGFMMAALLIALSFNAIASPSPDTPVILGFIVDESEFSGDLFFLIAVNENPDDNFWVRMDEETLLTNEFGEEIPIEDARIGSTIILMCYELRPTIKVFEAIIFIPEDEDEDDGDEGEDQE